MKLLDEERARQLVDALVRRAGEARSNVAKFYEFVIREETSRARIKTLPHQALLFKFVMQYKRSVVRLPVGFSKTMTMAGLSLFLLGLDPTTRGVVVSSAQGQAQKPLAMVRDYIEDSAELKMVFPKLQRSTRNADPWTQSKLVVERPRGIRDPSLTAVGVHGKLPGARLNWILVDDILNAENTATEEARKGVVDWFFSSVLSRRDATKTRIVVTNTPWHPEDLTYKLEKQGWPTLTMDAWGNVTFSNADDFDCDDIRPSTNDLTGKAHRLTAHDHPSYAPAGLGDVGPTWEDEHDEVYLWPERFGVEVMEGLRDDYTERPNMFHQHFSMRCRDEESAKMKVAYIEAAKERARKAGMYTFASTWRHGRTFTGVDPAVGKKRKSDRRSVFTFGLLPDKTRVLLRLESGRWGGKEFIEVIKAHHRDFGSIIRVENNAAQDFLRQWIVDGDKSIPIRGAPTGSNKHSKDHGIESIFIEFENGGWMIPNDPSGKVDPAVQRWIDGMLYYNPDVHTSDELMSCWIGWSEAKERGHLKLVRGAKSEAEQHVKTASVGVR